MTSVTEINFAAVCRACMANTDTLLSVASPLDADESSPITDVIEELTAIQVRTGDGLPESVCERCVQELRRFVEFIRQVRLTDRSLRQLFKASRTGSESKKQPLLEIQKVELDEENGVEEYLEYEEVIWKDDEKDHHEELIFELKMESGSDVEFQGFEESLEETKSVERVSNMRPVTGRGKPLSGKRKKKSTKPNGSAEAGCAEEMDDTEREMFQVLERQEGQLMCCGCYQVFDTEEEMAEHSAGHASKATINVQKKFVCPTCARRYTSSVALEAHRKHKKATKIYECIRCRARIVDPKRRYQHAHNHPEREVIQSEYLEPIRVMPRYGPETRICCATGCRKVFENETDMIAHAHEEHSTNKIEYDLPAHRDKPHECPVCFKRFLTYQSLLFHQKRRYRRVGSLRQCSLCGKHLTSAQQLASHERMHQNLRPFECQLCSKGFASAAYLKAHMLSHSTAKPFVCATCGTGFQRKGSLQKHEVIHMDQLPFQCQHCPKAFRLKARLDLHMRTHTGERPYSCRYCEKTFADHTNRHRHEMGHTGIKPYKCTYCDKTFITRRLQNDHESAVHAAVIIFTCNVCMATFNNKKLFREHRQMHFE
uniref:Zinc finger protein 454 n=1 Tax=Culex pipiens TaxID=7175 RepID=A0A8D8MRI4_CULPI